MMARLLTGVSEAQILPPPSVRPEAGPGLMESPRVFVRAYRFEGNTVFSAEALAKVTEPFANREVNTEELESARQAVSLYYIQRGYINSGAVIPDQDPAGGTILIRIVEGVLTETRLEGPRWFRSGYLKGQIGRWSDGPLNVGRLQEGLQVLRQDPNIQQINAELRPGLAPGESVLDLRVEDRQPFRLGLQIDNQRPPSVGSEQLWLLASDLNLTGHGDPLELRYGVLNSSADGYEFSQADNLEGSYRFPISAFGTTLGFQAGRLNTRLVEDAFAPLDIESLTTSYGTTLRQPVYQTANQEVALSLGFDYRKNRTWLLGQRFNLSPGAEEGEISASMVRFSQEWVTRGQDHVLALRSTFNLGLDILDASDNGLSGEPNGRSFHWLGQGQYVRRLFDTQNEVVLRLTGQWTSERLLGLEQFSIGGLGSVRGYLENQLVRDRGVISSVEFRVPVIYNKAGGGILHLAPFFDYGGGWNADDSPGPNTLASTGLGLLFSPNQHISAQVYWGYRLRHLDMPDDAGAQGLGFGFKININAF